MDQVLTPAQVESWRETGFCILESKKEGSKDQLGWIYTEEEAYGFREAARTAVLGDGKSIQPLPDTKSFGGVGFPFFGRNSEPLNDLTLHPRMLGAVKQLLKVPSKESVLLTQADCWVKRDLEGDSGLPAEYVNTDQRLHCDFPNHYLTHPTPWYEPEAVSIIVYLDESTECGGGTAYVPRLGRDDDAYAYPYVHMPGFGEIPWLNDRTHAEKFLEKNFPESYRFRQKLYARERRVKYRVGTILLYRLDVWHRGTPLEKNKDRAVVNLIYVKPGTKHITSWHKGWAQNVYNTWASPRTYPPQVGKFELLMSAISPDQRSTLGFPNPGHPYWTKETIRAVGIRYPHMDMRPYQAALSKL
jgi:hypothetical protein